jgi:hypothetical protein
MPALPLPLGCRSYDPPSLRRPLGIIAHHAKRVARAVARLPARSFFAAANPVARLLAGRGHPIEMRGRRVTRTSFGSPDELVGHHFETWSDPGHVNFSSLRDVLRLLDGSPSLILETGSSAWGLDSSRLFDAYVASFGGEFRSVDNRLQPMFELRGDLSDRSALICDDSVRFLRNWVSANPGRHADLVYLDSWDLEVSSPLPAAEHGLAEYRAVASALGEGSLLLIDDTPETPEQFPPELRSAARAFEAEHGMVPGKGMLVERELREHHPGATKLHHRYQVLYRFGGAGKPGIAPRR